MWTTTKKSREQPGSSCFSLNHFLHNVRTLHVLKKKATVYKTWLHIRKMLYFITMVFCPLCSSSNYKITEKTRAWQVKFDMEKLVGFVQRFAPCSYFLYVATAEQPRQGILCTPWKQRWCMFYCIKLVYSLSRRLHFHIRIFCWRITITEIVRRRNGERSDSSVIMGELFSAGLIKTANASYRK